MLVQHHRHSFGLVERGLAGAAGFGVGRQRLLQFVGQTQIIDNQAAGLVLEHAIDPGDGLHEPMPAHRLVHVHGGEARRVETSQPHVAHDHDLEGVRRVPEPLRQLFASRLVADVVLPFERIRGGTGHDDLHRSLLVIVAVPIGSQRRDLAVERHGDASAHAHHHRLAVHRGERDSRSARPSRAQ